MNIFEKIYSLLAILFEIGLIAFFLLRPEYRSLSLLLPASLVGLIVNTILIFLIFRDIYLRTFENPRAKIFWVVIILLFWPASLLYLLKYGFAPRQRPLA
jgi:hypothetical protein